MWVIILISLVLLLFFFNHELGSNNKLTVFGSIALIFTASLDLGLILLPPITDMTELGNQLGINPRSLEISLWTGLVWFMYLIAIVYFKYAEPKINLLSTEYSYPIYSAAVFLTFAFSIQLFIDTLPQFSSINPYVVVLITFIEAIFMFIYPKFKYIVSKIAIFFIISLPIIAVIIGADVDLLSIKDLPKAQFITYQHLDNPDVLWFFLWWLCWMLPIGKYLNSECKPIKMKWVTLMIVLIPILLVIPWISIEMTLDFIKSNTYFLYYLIFVATIYLSTCIVAMMYNTADLIKVDSNKSKYLSTAISSILVIAVVVVIYFIYISLEFIIGLYITAFVVGIINNLIKYKALKSPRTFKL